MASYCLTSKFDDFSCELMFCRFTRTTNVTTNLVLISFEINDFFLFGVGFGATIYFFCLLGSMLS